MCFFTFSYHHKIVDTLTLHILQEQTFMFSTYVMHETLLIWYTPTHCTGHPQSGAVRTN